MFEKFITFIWRYRFIEIVFWYIHYNSLTHLIEKNGRSSLTQCHVLAAIIIGFSMVSVYFNVDFNIPRFFKKKKYLIFLLLLPISIIGCAVLADLTSDAYIYLTTGKGKIKISYINTLSHAFDYLVTTFIFTAIYILIHYLQQDRKNQKLREKQLEEELIFLRTQINPHFIFNVLNSIYFLMDDNKERAQELLLKFSNLLRYQLYIGADTYMPLKKEMSFIQNLVEIEQTREIDNLEIETSISEVGDYYEIAPLILVTFVENAFKHVSHFSSKKNWLKIDCALNDNILQLEVSNSYEPKIADHKPGIGLKNVYRRLDLIYPDRYQLDIQQSEDMYHVKLNLKLTP